MGIEVKICGITNKGDAINSLQAGADYLGFILYSQSPRFINLENVNRISECLKDTVERFMPYWFNVIKPDIEQGEKVLIVAHGNSLRALVKYLDQILDEDILKLNIPTGVPLVYELDEDLKPIKSYFLGDQDEISKKADAVAAQGRKE